MSPPPIDDRDATGPSWGDGPEPPALMTVGELIERLSGYPAAMPVEVGTPEWEGGSWWLDSAPRISVETITAQWSDGRPDRTALVIIGEVDPTASGNHTVGLTAEEIAAAHTVTGSQVPESLPGGDRARLAGYAGTTDSSTSLAADDAPAAGSGSESVS